MPELPEVETVVRGLAPEIIGDSIIDIQTSSKKLRLPYPEDFHFKVKGKKFLNIKRRAKYIIAELSDNVNLIIHLGMTGKILLSHERNAKDHDHVIAKLESGRYLVYNDPRRFGLFVSADNLCLENHELFKGLGPEPLTEDFDAGYLHSALSSRQIPIKAALMDNKVVVGVGNIYACESLFRAKISPFKPANQITKRSLHNLIGHIRDVLLEAIDSGGSTLRDFVRSTGDSGYFQHNFAVYGRKDKACHKCNSAVKSKVIAGRNTFYCSSCQN